MPRVRIDFINEDELKIGETLGAGGFGDVVQVSCKRYGQVAYKCFKELEKVKNKKEIDQMKNHDHPNLVQFYAFVVDKYNQQIGYLMELMKGGSLDKKIHDKSPRSGLNERQSLSWMEQAARGLAFLHSKKVIHRDVKPMNMLLRDNNQLKICDLGLAKQIDSSTSEIAGSPLYIAPEVFINSNVGYASDVWSLGVTIWELYQRKRPFSNFPLTNWYEFAKKIQTGDLTLDWPYRKRLSCYSFIQKLVVESMLKTAPNERLEMGEIADRLEELKERCNQKSYIRHEETEIEEEVSELSLGSDTPSSSSSSGNSASKTSKKSADSTYEKWLTTSRNVTSLPYTSAELQLIQVKIEEATTEMKKLNVKRSIDGFISFFTKNVFSITTCKKNVLDIFAFLFDALKNALKLYPACKSELTEMIKETEATQSQFEQDVEGKLELIKSKSLK